MLAVITAVIIIGTTLGLGWWLLLHTEGVYLGQRTVTWLYDLYASRYDAIKDYQPEYEFALLAVPLMSAIKPQHDPLVLDVATGTGRLPLALLRHARFEGHIIGVDLSRKMLIQAAEKLAEDNAYVDLIRSPAETLPFDDNTFDIVTCLESLEFMANQHLVLRELARVLRPGGLMLITNRINIRLMPGRVFSDEAIIELLETYDMVKIVIEPWQVDYNRVWAEKAGESQPTGIKQLSDVLRCPKCSGTIGNKGDCVACGYTFHVTDEGIVDLTV